MVIYSVAVYRRDGDSGKGEKGKERGKEKGRKRKEERERKKEFLTLFLHHLEAEVVLKRLTPFESATLGCRKMTLRQAGRETG